MMSVMADICQLAMGDLADYTHQPDISITVLSSAVFAPPIDEARPSRRYLNATAAPRRSLDAPFSEPPSVLKVRTQT